MISDFKKRVDWFLSKGRYGQVIIILLLLIAYLGYNYHVSQEKIVFDVENLRNTVANQTITISKQQTKIQELTRELDISKMNNILSKANEDTSPIPMFLVEIKTGKILWVNKAYEKKYLTPNNTNRQELIGTDGTYVFGENEIKKFKNNNKLVHDLNRPLTFSNEVNATITKFPVKVGDYTYAIGGIEYVNFK